jgi:phosphatidylglycerol:prolipoprotein diacylglycerol transferase
LYNDLFSIGPVTVHTYGLMIGIGIICAYFLAEHRAKQKGMTEREKDKIFGLVIACVVFGFLCSKILYIITIIPELAAGTLTLGDAVSNGWVIFGGLLGGLLGGILYCKWQRLNVWLYFDVAFPAVALAQGFGRIGCFFAGCCYGVETDGPIYLEFTHSNYAPNGVHLVPTELIMSAGDFLLFAFLVLYDRKWKKKEGELAGWYLTLYSIGRFIVEFWRGDLIRGQVGPLSTSQFIGLFTAAAGILILLYLRRHDPGAAFRAKALNAENAEAAQNPEETENAEAAQNPEETENAEAAQNPEETENAEAAQNPEETGMTERQES